MAGEGAARGRWKHTGPNVGLAKDACATMAGHSGFGTMSKANEFEKIKANQG